LKPTPELLLFPSAPCLLSIIGEALQWIVADGILCPRRINKSPLSLEEPEKTMLKKMLTEPPIKKIDLHFPLGLEVTARNLKGVTIKDALDAIYKQFRKKVNDICSPPHHSTSLLFQT
jgi:hypothetical protein